MRNVSNYELFVKIDGDMVLKSNTVLSEMVDYFVANPSLDHAVFSVLDWFSQSALMGLHVFSNRCDWPSLDDDLFVDPTPVFPGDEKLVWTDPSPVAWHASNPSNEQSFRFGYHRYLKILQRGTSRPSFRRAEFHYDLLTLVYKQLKLDPDPRRIIALYGCYCAKNSQDSGYTSDRIISERDYMGVFDTNAQLKNEDFSEIIKNIDSMWEGRFAWKTFFQSEIFNAWIRQGVSKVKSHLFIKN